MCLPMTGDGQSHALLADAPDHPDESKAPLLPEIWLGLHASHQAWLVAADDEAARASMDDSDRSVLSALTTVDTGRWAAFCAATGWTPLAAAALSWCSGATLGTVRRAWEEAQDVLPADAEACRPARLMNAAILPAANPDSGQRSLSSIVLAGEDSNLQIAIAIAHAPAAVAVDLPSDVTRAAAPELAPHLRTIGADAGDG